MIKLSKFKFGFVGIVLMLSGCQALDGWQPKAGPSKKGIERKINTVASGLTIIELNGYVDRRVLQLPHYVRPRFSDAFRTSASFNHVIQAGDVIDVIIWEAPPALLFGAANDITALNGSKEVKIPEQMIDSRGQITIPFVGSIGVIGKTPQQVERAIVAGLNKKANSPSAMVRIVKNNSANVTVVGEVNNSVRMALTGKAERVLDAIAAAGGTKHPSSRTTIQLSRQGVSVEMLYDDVIKDPSQNVILQAGDVVSVNYQTQSFTVLGATAKNDEINFEAGGISLMQALARAGGLNDSRADIRGVFIFRQEAISMLTPEQIRALPMQLQAGPVVPVVYRLDLNDPVNYIVAQQFSIRDKDLIYVSNAPGAEFGKFLSMINQGLQTIGIVNSATK